MVIISSVHASLKHRCNSSISLVYSTLLPPPSNYFYGTWMFCSYLSWTSDETYVPASGIQRDIARNAMSACLTDQPMINQMSVWPSWTVGLPVFWCRRIGYSRAPDQSQWISWRKYTTIQQFWLIASPCMDIRGYGSHVLSRCWTSTMTAISLWLQAKHKEELEIGRQPVREREQFRSWTGTR